VRQGRTDAWIAHKLDISVEQLEQFKRDHLSEPEPAPPESAPEAREEVEVHEQVEAPEQDEEDEDGEPEVEAEPDPETQPSERARRRRRGRRGGRRRTGTRSTASYEGTFDHGGEGYGLWLDPAVADSQVYAEHWAGHRAVTVTVDADSITIRRIDDNAENTEDDAAEPLEP
jgi:transposase-like protein